MPGATITAKKALKADGAKLTTAQAGTLKVLVKGKKTHTRPSSCGTRIRTSRTPRSCSLTSTRGTSRSPTASTACCFPPTRDPMTVTALAEQAAPTAWRDRWMTDLDPDQLGNQLRSGTRRRWPRRTTGGARLFTPSHSGRSAIPARGGRHTKRVPVGLAESGVVRSGSGFSSDLVGRDHPQAGGRPPRRAGRTKERSSGGPDPGRRGWAGARQQRKGRTRIGHRPGRS